MSALRGKNSIAQDSAGQEASGKTQNGLRTHHKEEVEESRSMHPTEQYVYCRISACLLAQGELHGSEGGKAIS